MRCVFLLCLTICARLEAAQTWSEFRGTASERQSLKELPQRWSPTENVSWRVNLPGYGQSSPVVWQDQIFVTAVDGPEKTTCIVVALDAATGKALWRKDFASSQRGGNSPMMSRAAPTPVVDAEAVYVFFESGDLIKLSHQGEVQWTRSLSDEYGPIKNPHGLGSSLTQTSTFVIALVDHSGPSYLLAVDKATGKNAWKVDRTSRLSWTSPVVADLEGQLSIVTAGGGELSAYVGSTGELLWTVKGLYSNDIPSPLVDENRIYLTGGYNPLRPNEDKLAKTNCCVQIQLNYKQGPAQVLWGDHKLLAYHSSPLVHGGYLYIVTKSGVLNCLHAETSKKQYAARIDNACWATPIAVEDHIYFFGKDGVTTLIQSGPKFEKVATNHLWSGQDFVASKALQRSNPQNKVPLPPGPPETIKEMETLLDEAVGDVVYGVAAVDGAFVVRTGTQLFKISNAGGINRRQIESGLLERHRH